MKCLVLSVLVLAVVLVVNCRDVPGQTDRGSKAERLVKETADTELDVPGQLQGRTDNSQQLVKTYIATQHKEKAEDHEIEIRNDINIETASNVDNLTSHFDQELANLANQINTDITNTLNGMKDDISIELASNVKNVSSNLEQELANIAYQIDIDLINTLNDTITDMKDDINIKMASNVNNLSSHLDQELAYIANQINTDLTDMKGDIQDMTKVLEDIATSLQVL